jgi:hypothetical protein
MNAIVKLLEGGEGVQNTEHGNTSVKWNTTLFLKARKLFRVDVQTVTYTIFVDGFDSKPT